MTSPDATGPPDGTREPCSRRPRTGGPSKISGPEWARLIGLVVIVVATAVLAGTGHPVPPWFASVAFLTVTPWEHRRGPAPPSHGCDCASDGEGP
jgi:hypothetical protein